MKIAIMQPYFLPYIGYFELMRQVDLFVFLSDVQYIRQGWVNRNRIRSHQQPFQYLTVPVQAAARTTKIQDMRIRPGWLPRHLKMLQHEYGKYPDCAKILEFYETLDFFEQISCLAQHTVRWVAERFKFPCQIVSSADISTSVRARRLVDICHHFNADTYVNLPGGRSLYSQAEFGDVRLQFMPPTAYENKLSILDLLITEPARCQAWLERFVPEPQDAA